MATAFAPSKIQTAYSNSPTLKSLLVFMRKVSRSWTELTSVRFWFIICLNLVVISTFFALLKIQIAYLKSLIPKTLLFVQKISIYRTELKSVQFWPIFLNLVAIATIAAPLKIQVAYLNSPILKTLLFGRKITRYVYRNEMCAISAYFA